MEKLEYQTYEAFSYADQEKRLTKTAWVYVPDYSLALQLTDRFHHELVNDLIPVVELKYSTYAESTVPAGLFPTGIRIMDSVFSGARQSRIKEINISYISRWKIVLLEEKVYVQICTYKHYCERLSKTD